MLTVKRVIIGICNITLHRQEEPATTTTQHVFATALILGCSMGIRHTQRHYGHPEQNRELCPFDFQVRNLIIESPENDITKIRIIADETKQLLIKGKIKIKQLVNAVLPLKDIDKVLYLTMTEPDKYLKIILTCNNN